jgi:hypothetical protein
VTADADRTDETSAALEPVGDDVAGNTVDAADAPSVDAVPEPVVARSLPLPVTGNDSVDDALARLADLDERPTAEHAEVYEDVQGRLQRALADLDGR